MYWRKVKKLRAGRSTPALKKDIWKVLLCHFPNLSMCIVFSACMIKKSQPPYTFFNKKYECSFGLNSDFRINLGSLMESQESENR